MLNESIKNLRKAKGLSQEELAVKLHVVRQTVSKWETGLSVPDAAALISLAAALDTSVEVLLGETVPEHEPDGIAALSEKLAAINLQLAERSTAKRNAVRWALVGVCALILAVFAALAAMKSPYLGWNYSDPELAAAGTLLHGFEFVFVRLAPAAFLAAVIGIVLTGRRKA